jgi:hypothetical protein
MTPYVRAGRPAVVLLIAAFLSFCSREDNTSNALFDASETGLSAADSQAYFELFSTGFDISEGGRVLSLSYCGDIAPESQVLDLNGDGQLEAFVLWGNTCTSGMAGRSLTLLARNPDGSYRTEFGFPAGGWTALENRIDGWPDLSLGGPGFCHPLWRWSGEAYRFQCNIEETEGGCASIGDQCPILP